MTRLLFLPNDQTFLLLDSPFPASAVVEAVQSGQWTPPEPYKSMLAELQMEAPLRVFQQGTLVIITTTQPLDLDVSTVLARSKPQRAVNQLLTGRQTDVLQHMAEGLTTKEIAFRIGVAPRTVLMHIAAIKRRLGATTRAQSLVRAAALGLCKAGSLKSRRRV
jgi:DNA-binding NarL/FixJ family response regulator